MGSFRNVFLAKSLGQRGPQGTGREAGVCAHLLAFLDEQVLDLGPSQPPSEGKRPQVGSQAAAPVIQQE